MHLMKRLYVSMWQKKQICSCSFFLDGHVLYHKSSRYYDLFYFFPTAGFNRAHCLEEREKVFLTSYGECYDPFHVWHHGNSFDG